MIDSLTVPAALRGKLGPGLRIPPAAWLANPRDRPRQLLLWRSDRLLDDLEELRLRGRSRIPSALRARIGALRHDAGLPERPTPHAVGLAHDLVLDMQERWLHHNPRHPGVRATPPLPTGDRWRHLLLPPCPAGGPDEVWWRLARATVERAFERWCWAHHHAGRAAREGGDAASALRQAAAGWANYAQLNEELTGVAARVTGVPCPLEPSSPVH